MMPLMDPTTAMWMDCVALLIVLALAGISMLVWPTKENDDEKH